MALSDTDLHHLGRCVELTLHEERNRTGGGDPTQHPEFAIARSQWSTGPYQAAYQP